MQSTLKPTMKNEMSTHFENKKAQVNTIIGDQEQIK